MQCKIVLVRAWISHGECAEVSRLTHLRVYGLKAVQILVSESLFSRAPPRWIKG